MEWTHLHFVCLFFSPGNQSINVFVRVSTTLPTEDLVRAESDHLHEIPLFEGGVLLCQSALLNDGGVQKELAVSALDDLLLYGPFCDKPEDLHRLRLTDAVRPIHGLQIHLRVEIAVVTGFHER